jgi:hypothetical protein
MEQSLHPFRVQAARRAASGGTLSFVGVPLGIIEDAFFRCRKPPATFRITSPLSLNVNDTVQWPREVRDAFCVGSHSKGGVSMWSLTGKGSSRSLPTCIIRSRGGFNPW